MGRGFLYLTDTELLAWSLNFSTRISATPTVYGLTSALATSYATVHGNYATALAACDPNERNRSLVSTKNVARATLKTQARLLANLVDGTASVTNAQKLELGLTVRAQPVPVPAPDTAPIVAVESVNAWTVKVKLRSTDTAKRGKPAGVIGAAIFSYVGTAAPTDIAQWKFEGNTGKTTVDVVFPNTLTPGTKVYLTAFWFSGRKASGPAAVPVPTYIQGGSVSLAA